MKSITIVLVAFLVVGLGIVSAQDFVQGEAKGAEAPGAVMIGDNLTTEIGALFNGTPLQLSGVGAKVFDSAFFKSDGWAFDTTGYSMTPSMSAFLKDSPADGKPLTPAKKAAFVGSQSNPDDPRL